MNARIEIGGRAYVPLIAVPFLSGGFFTIGHVFDMIANYESFCDRRHDSVVSAFRITPDGRPVYVYPRSFTPLADTWFRDQKVPSSWSGAGFVVPEAEVRQLMQTILFETCASGTLDLNRPPACWDIDATLPRSVEETIRSSIRLPLTRVALRKNSKQAKLERLRSAIDHIEHQAGHSNVPFDRKNMLGRERDLLRLVAHVDPKATISKGNFDRHYAAALGLRWRQGSKPKDAGPLLDLFGMTVQ